MILNQTATSTEMMLIQIENKITNVMTEMRKERQKEQNEIIIHVEK